MEMTMNVPTSTIIASYRSGALSRFAATSLPVKTAARLRDFLVPINVVIHDFHKAERELAESAIIRDENDQPIPLTPEKETEVRDKLNELGAAEVTLPNESFSMKDFYASTAISAEDLVQLDWMIRV